MSKCASNIHLDELRQYNVDEVAHWLCQVGLRDHTAMFMERNINGNKLLNIKKFELKNYFISADAVRASDQFWNLLQAIRNNNHMPSKMDVFRNSRPPPRSNPALMQQRPVKGNTNRYPPAPPHLYPSIPHDSFSSDDGDDYIDDVETLPPARQAPTGPPLLTGPPPFTSPHRLTPKLPAKDRPQPPYPGHGGPAFGKRPAAPVPQAHDDAPAPPRPPRSPMMHGTRQSYDDHFLPSARQSIPEDFPAVPPPRPPQMGLTQMGPPQVAPPAMGPPQWGSPQMGPQPFKLPSRNSSKSSDSSHSPGSSRQSSRKDEHSPITHVPVRETNYSTGSNSSVSSDELTQTPLKPRKQETRNECASIKPLTGRTQFPSRPASRPVESTGLNMPGFKEQPSLSPKKSGKATDPTKPAEEQPWFFDGGRLDAQNKIEPYKKDGMFLVRPSSGMQPYALTLWARGKFFNFVIRKRDDGAYALGTYKENECSHKTVVNLIEHHQNNELKLADNEGSIILTSPP